MPELPEVEVVRRGLERVLPGKTIESIDVRWHKSFRGPYEALSGGTVQSLGRRGKMLQIHFDNGWTILVHLRMTGQLIHHGHDGEREGGGHPSDDLISSLPTKHTHVIVELSPFSTLYFNDQRKFGYLQAVPTAEIEQDSFLSKLGPEPWDEALTAQSLHDTFSRRSTNIKALLLNQEIIAGIGNIYADEALFLSGIHPTTAANTLDLDGLDALLQNVRLVLERGIEFGGVSARDYVNAEGLRGTMQQQLYVYGRAGEPCKQCGTLLEKSSVAGRGTHTCPQCQPRR